MAVDCSGSELGRSTALQAAAEWGRVSLLGEGGRLDTEVSDTMLRKNLTVHASWVTSVQGMEQLTWMLRDGEIHPDRVISHRIPLSQANEAYALAAHGTSGKVMILPEE